MPPPVERVRRWRERTVRFPRQYHWIIARSFLAQLVHPKHKFVLARFRITLAFWLDLTITYYELREPQGLIDPVRSILRC